FGSTRELFDAFVPANMQNIKAEFFIPIIADEFIKEPANNIKVIPTSSQWFGVTYKEDAPTVKNNIDALVQNKSYPPSLWKHEPALG
ncbi:MAG: nucleotidyltransferase, partial [Ferruginibacter sp.]